MVTASKRTVLEAVKLLKRMDTRARIAGDNLYNMLFKMTVGLMLTLVVAVGLNLLGWKIINLPLSMVVFCIMMLTFLKTDNLMTLLSIQIGNTVLPTKLQLEPLDNIFVLFLFLVRRLTFFVCTILFLLGIVPIEESFTSFMILLIGGILLIVNGNHDKEYKAIGGK
jgi:uncharacterized membrane protein YfhO